MSTRGPAADLPATHRRDRVDGDAEVSGSGYGDSRDGREGAAGGQVDEVTAWVLFHPLDVVTFRDGRPFTAGMTALARTTLPRPTSTGGAIGKVFGAANRPARIAGPLLVDTRGPVPSALFPAPADLLVEDGRARRVWPGQPDDAPLAAVYSDLQERTAADGPSSDQMTSAGGAATRSPMARRASLALAAGDGDAVPTFVSVGELGDYLGGAAERACAQLAKLDKEAAVAGGRGGTLAREGRLGIARHTRADSAGQGRTTISGFLYEAEFWRPWEEIVPDGNGSLTLGGHAFGCHVTFTGAAVPEPRTRMVRLGGEARQTMVAVVSPEHAPSLPAAPDSYPDGRVLLYLATPAVFAAGWLPDLPADATLVGACTTGPEVIASLEDSRRPRPLRWAVGPGSVYYLSFAESTRAAEYAAATHGACLKQAEDWMRTAGFGLCLVGEMVMGEAALLYFYAESAVHAGGSDSVGVIDLPIQRETTTRLPTVWGQSAKGALRDYARDDGKNWPDLEKVFGSAPPGSPGASTDPPAPGWLAVGDLRLVAFPVPTLRRTFAWVTSPLLLARQRRVADLAGVTSVPIEIPTVDAGQVVPATEFWATSESSVAVGEHDLTADTESVPLVSAWADWFADNALPAPPEETVTSGGAGQTPGDDSVSGPPGASGHEPGRLAGQSDPFAFFRDKLRDDLLVVADDDMAALTEEHAELLPRVQLDAYAKTVRQGPWHTEYLPAETILCSLLRDCSPDVAPADQPKLNGLKGRLNGELLVLGGDETLGKGMLWLRWRGSEV